MRHRTAYIATSVVLLCIVVCCACNNPSHHRIRSHGTTGEYTDTAVLRQMKAYRRAVADAEKDAIEKVKADTAHWVAHEFGWWYRYKSRGEAHTEEVSFAATIREGTVLHEQVYTLSDTLLVDRIRATGDNECFAYQRMIPYLVPGDTLMMIVPWFVGYGKEGNDDVPAYTSIRAVLTLATEQHDIPIEPDIE